MRAQELQLVIDTKEFFCTALYGDETTTDLSLQLSGARQRWCVHPSTSKSCRYFQCYRRQDVSVDARISLRSCCFPGFFACLPRSDPRFCCGYKKMLHKETNREIRQRLEVSIIRRTRCSFASLLDASLMNVGMVVVVRWKGIGRASKMVTLGFAFPLEARVVLWTSRIAITASEANRKTKGY